VELLLQRKADPSATDRRGLTAADLCKDPELKELLLAAQAQRDSSTAGSEPRLPAACCHCCRCCLCLLPPPLLRRRRRRWHQPLLQVVQGQR
jgi:hypothetical protein